MEVIETRKSRLSPPILPLVLLCGLLQLSLHGASAQSTIFNTPSTDIQTTRRFYAEAAFDAHLSSFDNGGFQLYGTRVVYGLTKRTEVGINAYYMNTTPAEPAEIQPNIKVSLYDHAEKGLAVAAGSVAVLPISHRSSEGSRARALVYVVASKNFEGTRAPRLTAGTYILAGRLEQGLTRKGVMLGYEQPVTKRLSLVCDWSSGRNEYGYLAVAAGFTISPRGSLYVGYNIGNQGRGNNSLGVYYGFSF